MTRFRTRRVGAAAFWLLILVVSFTMGLRRAETIPLPECTTCDCKEVYASKNVINGVADPYLGFKKDSGGGTYTSALFAWTNIYSSGCLDVNTRDETTDQVYLFTYYNVNDTCDTDSLTYLMEVTVNDSGSKSSNNSQNRFRCIKK